MYQENLLNAATRMELAKCLEAFYMVDPTSQWTTLRLRKRRSSEFQSIVLRTVLDNCVVIKPFFSVKVQGQPKSARKLKSCLEFI